MNFLKSFFSRNQNRNQYSFDEHPRLNLDNLPVAIYVIGDVHGELELLRILETKIVKDAIQFSGEKWIIMIGDLVDRGPKSADVIDHVMVRAPPDFKRVCLLGNHEMFFLRAFRGGLPIKTWMRYGGRETILSYLGVNSAQMSFIDDHSERELMDLLHAIVPQSHIEFLSSLPISILSTGYFFTHAGIRPGVELEMQSPIDLLMIRDDFIGKEIECDELIIHGHTIVEKVILNRNTINVDTGAYATRNLSCVRIVDGAPVSVLNTLT